MAKSLKSLISTQLEQLNNNLEKIRNTVIDSANEENWDPDHYSALQTRLEEALELLKDQVVEGKGDEYGDPIILEKGILTLLDEWKEKNNEKDE